MLGYRSNYDFTIDAVDSMLPVMRDPDAYLYAREWSGGILVGMFEPVSKPIFSDGVPTPFEYQLLPEDWDHLSKWVGTFGACISI